MFTLITLKTDFISAVKSLVELDYDALDAYDAAIDRVKNEKYINKLREFRGDHKRHTEELSSLLESHGESPPKGADYTKGVLAKGKVYIANLVGERAVLMAVQSNEEETVAAYEHVYNLDYEFEDFEKVLKAGLEDERKHKAWLDEVLSS